MPKGDLTRSGKSCWRCSIMNLSIASCADRSGQLIKILNLSFHIMTARRDSIIHHFIQRVRETSALLFTHFDKCQEEARIRFFF